MGICWCKKKDGENDPYFVQSNNVTGNGGEGARHEPVAPGLTGDCYFEGAEKGCPDSQTVDKLVLETLGIIGTLVDKYVNIFNFVGFGTSKTSICFLRLRHTDCF